MTFSVVSSTFAGSIVFSNAKKTKEVTSLSSEKFVWVRDQVRFQFPLRYPRPRLQVADLGSCPGLRPNAVMEIGH